MEKRAKSKPGKKRPKTKRTAPINCQALLKKGHGLQQAGRMDEARNCYQQVLARLPQNVMANHLLGMTLLQQGAPQEALAYLQRAVEGSPIKPELRLGLAYGLRDANKINAAVAEFQKVLEKEPGQTAALEGLAGLYLRQKDPAKALPYLKEKSRQVPADPQSHYNLGVCYQELHRLEEALESYQRALDLSPGTAQTLLNMGRVNHMLGNLAQAIENNMAALKLNPDYAEAHCNLASVLMDAGRPAAAIDAYEKARALKPGSIRILNSLGIAYNRQGALQAAINCFRKALKLDDTHEEILNSLAGTLLKQGYVTEALTIYERALSLHPENPSIYSNWLLSLHYPDGTDPRTLFERHRRWTQSVPTTPPATVLSPPNVTQSGDKIRIGYVSPDFRKHSVAYFMTAVLATHDRKRFDIFGYTNSSRKDTVTERIQGLCNGFHPIFHLTDEKAADLIASHKIDILIDLAGHTSGGRLSLFARRPATVQVTYLGYPDTSGLHQMDYRITDETADPCGWTESFHTEKLWRLPNCFLCYEPSQEAPPVERQEPWADERIVLGSFNNRAKISATSIRMWSKIMRKVPEAELWLKSKSFNDPEACELLYTLFEKAGVNRSRIRLIGYLPETDAHLALYNRIDVALDTFPYNGTTTTCEALWMGVPVVTLGGRQHASRVGASLMTAIGCRDWIAENESEYVDKVVRLANDVQGRMRWHKGLRTRMQASPLMDAKGFTRNLERAFAEMMKTQGVAG